MSWIGWVVIVVMALIFILDWVIVMGADPRKWKGRKR